MAWLGVSVDGAVATVSSVYSAAFLRNTSSKEPLMNLGVHALDSIMSESAEIAHGYLTLLIYRQHKLSKVE
jgi:hypothetical protein